MKVACDGCGAKYAIPEDKIQGAGRTFKVTCRQCNAPILIQGVGSKSEAKWYFALGRERQGPIDALELASKVKDELLTKESLIWSQGMDGWQALGTIDEITTLIDNQDAEQAPEDISNDTTLVAQSEIDAAHAAMDAEEDRGAEASVQSAALASEERSMLDGLFDQETPLETNSAKHERADTSVLFSLEDLAKSSDNPLPGFNFQGGQGSGLLDVSATKPRSANRRRPLTQSPFDDGPAPAAQPNPAASATIAVPIIKRRSNPMPIILGALGLLAGGAFAAMQMMSEESDPTPQALAEPSAVKGAINAKVAPAPAAKPQADKATPKAPKAAPEIAAKASPKPPKAEVPKAEPDNAEGNESEETLSAAERRKKRREERRERRERRKEQRSASNQGDAGAKKAPKKEESKAPVAKAESKSPAAKPQADKAKPTAPKKDVNALLATLNKNKGGQGGGAAASNTGNLPQRLSSSKLRSTLRRKKGTFNTCYKKMSDRPPGGITVNTSLVVSGSGSVKSARITSGGGASAGVLRCISSALKSTKFPPFAASQMSVNYPISLR